jgi:hypothetical protein
MMQVIVYVVLGSILAAAGIAVLWTLFFTSVVPWSGHSLFTPYLFLLGGLIGSIFGLQRAIR